MWVTGPAERAWEVYTVLADSETFGTGPQHLDDPTFKGGICCGGSAAATESGQPAATASCC